MKTRFTCSGKKRMAIDAASVKDKCPTVINGENCCNEKRLGDSLDSLDLFHSLPISEQGRGREVVEYE